MKSLTIGLIHATVGAVQPMIDTFASLSPEVKVLNFVDENLLNLAKEKMGSFEPALREFTRLTFKAAEAGLDGMIVCCSLFCPYVPLIQPFFSFPVIAIDSPMLETAVTQGNKIGIIATVADAGPVTKSQIEDMAGRLGRKVECTVRIAGDAFTALRRGDVETHDRRIAEAGRALSEEGCDSLVLCQITMARAAGSMRDFNIPVLTSPGEGVRKILSLCDR